MTSETRLELEIEPLDLDLTLGCGQTFRWIRSEDSSWSGPLGASHVRLRKTGRVLEVRTQAAEGIANAVRTYLRANDDISAIQRTLRRDQELSRGIRGFRGLRIVKLDEWECLISYVLATYANIPRIAKMIDALAREYGKKIDGTTYAFPAHRSLASASEHELGRCGLGYRARYVRQICEAVDEDRIEELKRLGYRDLREELIALPGVGDKVADCVSLFGFGRLEAFPIDVWIERAMKRIYGQSGSYARLREFASARFGPYAGYAQEYLYHNERMRAKGRACAFSHERQE